MVRNDLERERVLQVHNIAYVSGSLAYFLNRLGFNCRVLTKTNRFAVLLSLRHLMTYDIIHYHGNTWLVHNWIKNLDHDMVRILRKKVFLHFHGSELRIDQFHLKLKRIIRKSKAVFVSTPDLLSYLPTAIWLRNPIDMDFWRPANQFENGGAITIGYYKGGSPSQKKPPLDEIRASIYTTPQISKAINTLRNRYKIREKPAYGIPRSQMPNYYRSLDIFVDKLGIGWYSQSACEAAASGLPVITYISKDLRSFLGREEPFLISSEKRLVSDLASLIEDVKLRREYGRRGRRYVMDTHDGFRVTKTLINIYNEDL